MDTMDDKNGTVIISLKADSGYKCKSEDRISANQWRDINKVLNGSLFSVDELVEPTEDLE